MLLTWLESTDFDILHYSCDWNCSRWVFQHFSDKLVCHYSLWDGSNMSFCIRKKKKFLMNLMSFKDTNKRKVDFRTYCLKINYLNLRAGLHLRKSTVTLTWRAFKGRFEQVNEFHPEKYTIYQKLKKLRFFTVKSRDSSQLKAEITLYTFVLKFACPHYRFSARN